MENKELKFNMDLEVLKNDLQEGHTNALLFLGQLKRIENEFVELKKIALPMALDEFDLQSDKTYSLGNYDFSKTSGGRYNYKHSDEWMKLNEDRKELEKKMQNAAKSNIAEMVDAETGEVIHAAIYIPSKESISIKLK